MDKVDDNSYMTSLLPENRLKRLYDISVELKVDVNMPAVRYFKSGVQMIRRADMHLQEGHYEEAFILYMKYCTLFVEKIRQHPDLKNVAQEDIRAAMKKLKEVMPKAEKLKVKLLDQYTNDLNHYLEEKEAEKLFLEQRKKEEEEKCRKFDVEKNITQEVSEGIRGNNTNTESVKPVPYLPDDFLVYELPENKTYGAPASFSGVIKKPGVDRSTKPSSQYTSFSNSKYSHLRTIIIPSKMLNTFLVLAQKNTINNVETCGILAGKLKQNRLVVTHLLIPKQYGTSDSCSTDNEEDLFNYQNELNLITLGWIHTHPSQTAFLSSVDLHTHYSYQLMMSESIAIVCAPRYAQTGFFRLTPNYGLDFIANCQQKGFHPHPSDPPLFQDADHYELDENSPVEVIDLRR